MTTLVCENDAHVCTGTAMYFWEFCEGWGMRVCARCCASWRLEAKSWGDGPFAIWELPGVVDIELPAKEAEQR